MRRVLARAQLREARRAEAFQKVIQAQPEAPKGLLAAFRKEAHRQAVAAWDHARAAAARLAVEAKQLVERLRDIARPERVKAWAQALVGQNWPQAVVTQQMSEPRARLEREAASVFGLLEQAKTHPLTLPEKQQLARGWNGMARLIDEGYQVAPVEFRQSVEAARRQANRQVAADMFLHLPRAEVLQHYPALASHYALLEAIDRQGKAQKWTSLRRVQERKQAQQRMAAAIEQGDIVRFRSGRLEVLSRQGVPASEVIPREQDRERGQEPPERPSERPPERPPGRSR